MYTNITTTQRTLVITTALHLASTTTLLCHYTRGYWATTIFEDDGIFLTTKMLKVVIIEPEDVFVATQFNTKIAISLLMVFV